MQAAGRLARLWPHLGPHAGRLLGELLAAFESQQGESRQAATVIILAAAVLDVALREPSGPVGYADGIDIAAARDNPESFWLRERRNGIVHYEGGRGGLMGEAEDLLTRDMERAAQALADALDMLIRG